MYVSMLRLEHNPLIAQGVGARYDCQYTYAQESQWKFSSFALLHFDYRLVQLE